MDISMLQRMHNNMVMREQQITLQAGHKNSSKLLCEVQLLSGRYNLKAGYVLVYQPPKKNPVDLCLSELPVSIGKVMSKGVDVRETAENHRAWKQLQSSYRVYISPLMR